MSSPDSALASAPALRYREERRARQLLFNASRLLAVVLLVVGLSLASDAFLTPQNLLNVVRQASFLIILALGMTLAILTAGIDLSVGGVFTLSACLGSFLIAEPETMLLGVACALAVGAIFGLVNGLLVAHVKLPPFIATYGTLFIASGISLGVMGGQVVRGFPPAFRFIGSGYVGPVPAPIVVMLVVAGLTWLLLRRTTFGRAVYAIGANRHAARFSGIRVERTLLMVYVLSGLLAAFAGLMFVARLNAAQINMGEPFTLTIIAAVTVGGTSLFGGEGGVIETMLGALILTLITNGMNLLGIDSLWQTAATGAVILLSVSLDRLRQRWG